MTSWEPKARLKGTNALTYFVSAISEEEKSFITLPPDRDQCQHRILVVIRRLELVLMKRSLIEMFNLRL